MISTPQQFMDAYIAAIHAADIDQMMALYADDVVVFDAFRSDDARGFQGWEYRGKPAWRQGINSWFDEIVPSNHARYDQLEVIDGTDVCAVHARVLYKGDMKDGSIAEMWNRYSAVLRREGNELKVVFEHTSLPAGQESEKVETFGDN